MGVAQSDIFIGDPNINMTDATYVKCHNDFPRVQYLDTGSGQLIVKESENKALFAADDSYSEYLPQEYLDATYIINIPVFKKHHRAGISICCKNHFGSVTPFTGNAFHLHPSLPCPNATGKDDNGEYGSYRCFVDIMGHKDLGGKTILFLVDGIWGSINWGHPAVKWAMPPFNNDYPSSLFVSLDPVAIESVCFDFLFYEFDENHPTEGIFIGDNKGPFPHFAGVDDYLHQSADVKNWPAGINYDPEDDGTILKSMGTHEHWNNAIDKKYSRNLLAEGKGIELVKAEITSATSFKNFEKSLSISNYPNPFTTSTAIKFRLEIPSQMQLNIYDLNSQKINQVNFGELAAGDHRYVLNAKNSNGLSIPAGTYIYSMDVENKKGNFQFSNKMLKVE